MHDTDSRTLPQRPIKQVARGMMTQDGAGVAIRRVLGTHTLREIDPFLLLDELRSDDPNDYIAGFPDHPHRGFETVTYMLQGKIRHRDSLGNEGLVGSGGVQWMRAGRGIIHSEIPEQSDGLLWGFQIWVNLPAERKMIDPAHRDIPATEIPLIETEQGATVKLIAGTSANGQRGPLQRDDIGLTLLDVTLPANGSFHWPVAEQHILLVYVYKGGLVNGTSSYPVGAMLVFGEGSDWSVLAGEEGAGLLLLAAEPIREPISRAGPFVMNSDEEIRQAIEDYQSGRLAS